MTALQKNVQSIGFSTEFDVLSTPQNAYSHGLESIYKLECIDLKSVRKFSMAPEKSAQKDPISLWEEVSEPQLSFDLGPAFRGWMVPSVLQEPVQVLQLSRPVEKNLLEKGLQTLGALEQASLQGFGIGQGHIEELRRKLGQYLEGKPRLRTARIDFQSFIKCLLGDLEWKKVYVFLAAFGIAEWVVLSAADSADVKKLSFENKQRWCGEVQDQLKTASKAAKLQSFFLLITETWTRPWMRVRGGLATKEEIVEALLVRSLDSRFAKGALELLFTLDDPLKSLFLISGGFAASAEIRKSHELMEKTALSYFKNPSIPFSLKNLCLWGQQELARRWEGGVGRVMLEKSIRFSPYFDLLRDCKSGEWMVAKNFFGGL
jgi:hypothetical protein